MSAANYRAVNATVRAMRAAGQLESHDDALVALVRTTARAVDSAELGTAPFASCARAHALALERLRSLTGHADDSLERLLDKLGAPTVGNTADT